MVRFVRGFSLDLYRRTIPFILAFFLGFCLIVSEVWREGHQTMEEAEAALPKGADELDSVLKFPLPSSSPSHEAGAFADSLEKLRLEGKVAGWSDARVVEEEGNEGFEIQEKSGYELNAERDEKEELAGRKARVSDVDLWLTFEGEQVEKNVVDMEELTGEADGTPKDDVEKSMVQPTSYPQRPGTLDCSYYLRTGTCRYGENCKFNHPLKIFAREVGQELSGRDGGVDCKFFLTSGGCKFGNACRFSHSQEKTEILEINFNFLGLPIRPGQKECPYYMRTGSCKFSRNCWYTHPDPTVMNAQDYLLGCQNGVPPQQHSSVETNLPTSYFGRNSGKIVPDSDFFLHCIPSALFPPKGLNFTANRSQVPGSQSPSSGGNFYQPLLINLFSNKKNIPQQADVTHPERPDQPDCPYFMKTGDCKFGSACKFHHPRSRLTGTSGCNINPLGLPLRPDQPICTFYNRFGICKFGPACKFDHPMSLAFSSHAAASFGETSDVIEQKKDIKVADND